VGKAEETLKVSINQEVYNKIKLLQGKFKLDAASIRYANVVKY